MRRRLASAAWLLALWNSPLAAQEPRPADQRALAALEGARVVSEQGYLRIEKRVQPLARVRSTERFHGQMPWQSTPFARPWILVQHAGGLLELEGSDRRRGSSQQAEFYNGREVQSAREKFDELRAFLEAAELRAEGPEIEWEAIPVAGGGELLLASVEQPTRAPGRIGYSSSRVMRTAVPERRTSRSMWSDAVQAADDCSGGAHSVDSKARITRATTSLFTCR